MMFAEISPAEADTVTLRFTRGKPSESALK
jgi:hypothetical protein